MKPITEILSGLNPQQQQAVRHKEGPLLVLAGAGSGKTRVLTRRIAYLIEHYGVEPRNILAVTFTNKAADEMKNRVKKLLPSAGGELFISTFHSFCVRVLRREMRNNFVIFDTYDQKKVIREVVKDLDIERKKVNPGAVMTEISKAKNKLVTPLEYSDKVEKNFFTETVSRIYPAYQQKLTDNNALDFADLIMKTVDLFREYPVTLKYYQGRFKYLLIDEYQDVNFAQYRLGQLLTAANKNLFAVGDPDQSIYGFRGADISNILNFEEDYPGARIIKLEQNYRSHQKILDAAQSVISNNVNRREKTLWSSRGAGEDIQYYVASNEKDEADYVCRRVRKLVRLEGYNYGDIVVLYRTNAQSRVFEEFMMKYGFPFQIVGGVGFYERKEIRDVLAYLRVLYNPEDDISLLRIINRPRRGIGDKTVAGLQKFAAEEGINLYEAGIRIEENPYISRAYRKRVEKFFTFLEDLRDNCEQMSLVELTDRVVTGSGYIEKLRTKNDREAQNRLENIEELFSMVEDFNRGNENGGLRDFLEEVSLLSDIDSMEDDRGTVTMMTLHSAKGLEAPVVFLVGMEEGLFPHSNSLDEEKGLEEERRLCYVGLTRARDRLYITRARKRMRFGEKLSYPPSQFLREIPDELLASTTSNGMGIDEEAVDNALNSSPDSPSGATDYKPGQEVVHPSWGIGEIIEVKKNRGLELKVDFGREGEHTLLAEYAPIQRKG